MTLGEAYCTKLKNKTMKKLHIRSSNIYNNATAVLNINLSNGKTMRTNLLDSDKKKYLKKELTKEQLVSKYYALDGDKATHLNPQE